MIRPVADHPPREPADMDAEPMPRGRTVLVVLAAVTAACLATAAAVVAWESSDDPVGARARPSLLPAASIPAPAVVSVAGGRQVTCPTGSVPSVMLAGGEFVPPLVRGSKMGKARYHIHLTGTVNNETGAAVSIRELTATVRGVPWPARITVAGVVPPQSSAPLVIEGDYLSTQAGPVDVRTQFDWRWHAADLAECGGQGLTKDD
jgi:hypothetical protein